MLARAPPQGRVAATWRGRAPWALLCLTLLGAAGQHGDDPGAARQLSEQGAGLPVALQEAGVTSFDYGWTVSPTEGFSSQRTRVFPFACGPDAAAGQAMVEAAQSATQFPGAYGLITRGHDEVYVLGGVNYKLGQRATEPPFVAKLDATTLAERWRLNLANQTLGWELSGSLALDVDGYPLINCGTLLVRVLDAVNGTTPDPPQLQIKQLPLPEGTTANNTIYVGFVVLSDGSIVTKSLHRNANCTRPGTQAITSAPPCNWPTINSSLVLLDGATLEELQTVPTDLVLVSRLTSAIHRGREYVYTVGLSGRVKRWLYSGGRLSPDTRWEGLCHLEPGGEIGACTAAVPMNGWLVMTSNAYYTEKPLALTALWQDDPQLFHYVLPFEDAGPGFSWGPTAVAVEAETGMVYVSDFLAGRLAGYRLSASGLERVWVEHQYITDFLQLIGPTPEGRVLVSSNLTNVGRETGMAMQLPLLAGQYNQGLIFRDALTGRELMHSPDLGVSVVMPNVPGWASEGNASYFHLSMFPVATLTRLSYPAGSCSSDALLAAAGVDPTGPP